MKRIIESYMFRNWISYLLLATAIIAVFMVASEIRMIWGGFVFFMAALSPFVSGFVISYVLNIPRERIERVLTDVFAASSGRRGSVFVQRRKRGISVLITYLGVILLVALLMNIVVPRVYDSIIDFIAFLPVLLAAIEGMILALDTNDAIPFFNIAEILNLVSWEEILTVFNPDNINMVFDTIMDFTSAVFGAALAIISSIYFLLEGDSIKAFAIRVMKTVSSSVVNDAVLYYSAKVNGYFKRYIYCQVLDALILGVIMTVATSVLGVRHAFVIGPMLGVANLIPYFGSIIGTFIAIIIILLTDGFTLGIAAALVMLIIQQIDANVIFPRLLGGSMKISPLLVIIAITLGNAYYGIFGMIISIPIVTVLKNILDDILLVLEQKKAYRERLQQ